MEEGPWNSFRRRPFPVPVYRERGLFTGHWVSQPCLRESEETHYEPAHPRNPRSRLPALPSCSSPPDTKTTARKIRTKIFRPAATRSIGSNLLRAVAPLCPPISLSELRLGSTRVIVSTSVDTESYTKTRPCARENFQNDNPRSAGAVTAYYRPVRRGLPMRPPCSASTTRKARNMWKQISSFFANPTVQGVLFAAAFAIVEMLTGDDEQGHDS